MFQIYDLLCSHIFSLFSGWGGGDFLLSAGPTGWISGSGVCPPPHSFEPGRKTWNFVGRKKEVFNFLLFHENFVDFTPFFTEILAAPLRSDSNPFKARSKNIKIVVHFWLSLHNFIVLN